MKTTPIVTVAAILYSSHAAAQEASPQIYGRLNLALERATQQDSSIRGTEPGVRESNYRSVLGFRGSEALGNDLHLIFQIEGAVAPDTGTGAIASRDTRIGFEGSWGTLFAGNWTTPYNSSTSALDPFYPTTAGYTSIMGNGSAASANNVSDTASFDRRQQNSLHYWTPAWRGLSLRLARGFNEESPPNGAKPSLNSGAVIFERGPMYASLAHERHHDYQGPDLTDWGTKLAVAYQFGSVKAAVIAEKLRYETATGPLERLAYYMSLTRQIGAHGIRFGVARAHAGTGTGQSVGFIRSGDDTGAIHYTLGYDYALSKRTTLFAFNSHLRNDARGVYDFSINGLAPTAGASLGVTAVGIRHSF